MTEFAVRATDRCNLNCAYCYAKVEHPKDMSLDTLDRVLSQIAEFSDGQAVISWTGGEPLIMGHGFFERIAETQARLGADKFVNILQSNLTLLDEWYVEFLAKYGFQVRTSLDLPRYIHNEMRRREHNFASTLEKIAMLQSAGIPLNVNTVVTNRNILAADIIFAELKQLGITSFSVSRLVQQGNATEQPELTVYDNDAFGRFLIRLFDLWVADNREPKIERITPLDKLLAACKRGSRDEGGKCFHCQSQMFAIGPDGGVFPSCNKFFALPATCLGNVNSASLQDILRSEKRQAFIASTGNVSTRVCGKCEYVEYCEGGCYYVAYNALTKGEEMHTREKFCKGYYLVFERILAYLKGE